MHKLLAPLNEKQRQAVQSTDGPILILAGAGSGKTKTLIHRIAYLIAQGKTKPWNILAVTFTNKAAGEIRDRLKMLLGKEISSNRLPITGTFHSICVQILRREIKQLGYEPSFVIYDQNDSETLIKKCLKDLGYDTKTTPARVVQYLISGAKNELKDVETFAGEASETMEKTAAQIYDKYQTELKLNNALDFDDLIMLTVNILKRDPDVLKKYQAAFKYILVDEYQDTNHAQYTLVNLLADQHHNICVVGDDFQSIYSWRGANMQNILDFEEDYPKAKIVLLEQNYRSTQHILDAANEVIKYNTNQKEKVLWTENERGHKIILKEVANEQMEGDYIIREIFDMNENDLARVVTDEDNELKYLDEEEEARQSILDRVMQSQTFKEFKKDVALQDVIKKNLKIKDLSKYVILYRTNAQSRALEEAFLKYNVPYRLIGSVKFYERREIKDLIAYLRILVNPNDLVSLERVINVPARSLGINTLKKIEQACREHEVSFIDLKSKQLPKLRTQQAKAFASFQKIMKELTKKITKLSPSEILTLVAKKTGYQDIYNPKIDEDRRRLENIDELKSVTKKFDNKTGTKGLEAFLEEITLISDQDEIDETTNAVTMMTVHAAKGLEFDTVFITGMEEGLFPHSRSLFEPLEMEEERRLCYVAITRARKKAYIIHAAQRTVYGNTQISAPSRFINDIPKTLVQRL